MLASVGGRLGVILGMEELSTAHITKTLPQRELREVRAYVVALERRLQILGVCSLRLHDKHQGFTTLPSSYACG